LVKADDLRQFIISSLEKAKLTREDSLVLSDALVEADLRGVHSHGVQNLPRYVRGFFDGQMASSVTCPFVVDAGSLSIIDGQNGIGFITCNKAMDIAIDRAKKYGIAMVGVRNSNHFGAAAYFSMKALAHDQIGFCTTNGPPIMAPWGGCEGLIGNNPFSYAIPADKEPPIVLDMACSTVARGKIRLKARENQPIPEGWAISKTGEPTTDVREALEGTVLPTGGYKGYGIAVINEVLSAALTGALFSYSIPRSLEPSKGVEFPRLTSWRCGHWVDSLDIGKIIPIEEFKHRIDELCRTLKNSTKAKGYERIYLPGEIEYELKKERLLSGIPLPDSVIKLLNSFAKEIGITPLETSRKVE
jgi:LDH2 family malate/lactate/ureidoglycolate dehydrogenase